ncbi:ATP-dependent helicase [Chryseobacterium nakagawai]|uniref:DEAD/DEAH box helicase n=1 Tax=Chryseobacterium nakagawai TaxID=1241982 RepID=A0AAD1DSK9_CHRNA|nr:DEAD/DEAH box helicase [Chryseobacterium nakagawai]AZA93632.1 DEAD/DEAH box helicase [Chryseobacterium nakagawai]VEH20336.1 ATP-dependent helicase [Chryseobacterium nakagawai]
MRDPIGSFLEIKENFIRYVQTAFRTNSENIEEERYKLLNTDKVLFRMPWIEPLPDYLSSGKKIDELTIDDFDGNLSLHELRMFKELVKNGLVDEKNKLYSHQAKMLKAAISGNNCIITSGTGSGKTESFLLPLFAQLAKELSSWKSPNLRAATQDTWWRENTDEGLTPSKIVDEATHTLSSIAAQRSNEVRQAGVRALILYPMNALVEDQMTRLRKALDSDDKRDWLKKNLGGNKIFFGRYNSNTPVSGRLFKLNGDGIQIKNDFKIRQLKKELYNIENDALKVERFIDEKRKDKKEAIELKSFFPRLDGSEMRSRFDMQIAPPDIMITNYSMLSIMLMREVDSGIFEKTRSWLACEDLPEAKRNNEKKNRVFHLIIDELHLYRGTQGSEVAYLLKLVLNRLGLHPEHDQLRILASSASLEPADEKSMDFLRDFFGVDTSKKPFIIIPGENNIIENSGNFEHKLSTSQFSTIAKSYDSCKGDISNELFIKTCDELGNSLSRQFEIKKNSNGIGGLLNVLCDPKLQLRERLYKACETISEDVTLYNAVCSVKVEGDDSMHNFFAERLFSNAEDLGKLILALRGILILRALIEEDKILSDNIPEDKKLPRFRFHYFFRNIEGLWASVDENDIQDKPDRDLRNIGKIYPVSKIKSSNGNRILELLYCDNCGTTLLGGSRLIVENEHGGKMFELLPISPNIEGIPEKTPAKLVESRSYQEYAIFWPSGEEIFNEELVIPALNNGGYWRQTTINGHKQVEYHAKWIKASLNKKSGNIVNQHDKADKEPKKWVKGYYFTVTKDGDRNDIALNYNTTEGQFSETHKALPNVCPACGINHRKHADNSRIKKTSSIRGFRTGFAKTTQTFAKELMYQLPNEKDKRKLIVFSDSREDAAQVANGIERNHFTDLQRELLVEIFNKNINVKAEILRAIKNNDQEKKTFYLTKNADLYYEIEDLYEKSISTNPNPLRIIEKEKAIKELQKIRNRIFPVEEIVLSYEAGALGPLLNKLLALGINPGGNDIKIQTSKQGNIDLPWYELIDFKAQKWKLTTTDSFKTSINDEAFENLASIFFGSLFYSLESSALGYLSINPEDSKINNHANRLGLSKETFIEVVNSVIRIMGDKYKHNRAEQLEKSNFESYNSFPAAVKLYVKAISLLHSKTENEVGASVFDLMKELHILDRSRGIIIEKLFIKVTFSQDHYWKSTRGNKIHLHKSGGIDTFSNQRLNIHPSGICDDIWSFNYLSYNALKNNRNAIRLHCEELTGQTDDQFERQRHFRNIILTEEGNEDVKAIDLLSVTTTLEVGVDIGALQAVMLGNMPPQRFNYQQRVGRAGRRGQAYSVILTFCRGRSHDEFYFSNPQKITGDPPPTPFLTMGQERIFKRLLAKDILRNAYQNIEINVNNDEDKSSVHGEFGKIANWESYRPQINAWIVSNHNKIRSIVSSLISFQLKGNEEAYVNWVIDCDTVDCLMNRIQSIIENREISNSDISEKLAEGGVLPMFGMPTTVKNLYHGFSKTNKILSIDRPQAVAIYEFAPGAQKTKDKGIHQSIGFTSDLYTRNLGNNTKIENFDTEDHLPFSLNLWYVRCKSCGYFQTYDSNKKEELIASGELTNCPGCGENNPEKYHQPIMLKSPIAYRTDFSGGRDSKDDSPLLLSRPPIFVERSLDDDNTTESKPIFNTSLSITDRDVSWRINSNSDNFFKGKRLITVNNIPFPPDKVWLKNQWISSELETEFKNDDYSLSLMGENEAHEDIISLASQKKTEVFRIAPTETPIGLSLDMRFDNGIRSGYYSLAFLLQRILADKLDVDPMEIEIADIPVVNQKGDTDKKIAEIILTDELQNGSGFVRRMYEEFETIIKDTLDPSDLESYVYKISSQKHLDDCKDACYDCLKIYRNMNYHSLLDWRLGISMMRVLHDSDYKCGIDGKFDEYFELRGWISDAKQLTVEFCNSFDNFSVAEFNGLPVITWGQDQKNVICIVHPFWSLTDFSDDYWLAVSMDEIDRYVTLKRGKKFYFDTFNLHRRPGWCYEKLMKE